LINPYSSVLTIPSIPWPNRRNAFCIEEQLGVDTVKLIYDSDPGGGEPIPEEEEYDESWMDAVAG
jgi:hypothetical protein